MKRLVLLSFLALSSPAVAADLNAGMQALGTGNYHDALMNLQPLALQGNAEAAYKMCGMYYLGQGVPKNDIEAVNFCKIGAEHGNIDAQYNLALFYQQGTGTRQDLTEATRWYASAAASGHPDAKFNLDQMRSANNPGFITPQEAKKDLATAVPVPGVGGPGLPKSAAAADPHAAAPILPAGTPAPMVMAAQQQAAQVAAPVAPIAPVPPVAVAAPMPPTPPPIPPVPPVPPTVQNQINQDLAKQSSPELDVNRYCLMAAQRGNPDPKCKKEYSDILPKEPKAPLVIAEPAPQPAAITMNAAKPAEVVAPASPAPVAKAVEKTTLAKPAGFLDAPKAKVSATLPAEEVSSTLVVNTIAPIAPIEVPLATAVVPDEKPSEANSTKLDTMQTLVAQAKANNPQAQNYLGVMYRKSMNNLPKDPKQAIGWFENAASRGDTNAMMNLASMYKEGEGTKKNPELAYAWYNLAADRLDPNNPAKANASENVQELSKKLSNQQIGFALQYVTQLDETIPVLETK